jgi:iron complex transport system ATP-binding protein
MGFELDDIAFAFAGRTVLDGVSLALEGGRFHGIVGPNGSGKTTLVDLLCRYRRPQRGAIRLGGRPLPDWPRRELARAIALVPQNFYINFPFTVRDVVMMGRHPYIPRFGAPSAHDVETVERVLAEAGVAGMSDRLVTELSGGERQRVVIARALAQDTPVLILDEATSNLDVGHAVRLLGLAADQVRRQGRTAVGVFQDLNQAAAWCDRLVFMRDGRVAAAGPTADVLTPETIASVFGVRARVFFEPFSNSLQVAFSAPLALPSPSGGEGPGMTASRR